MESELYCWTIGWRGRSEFIYRDADAAYRAGVEWANQYLSHDRGTPDIRIWRRLTEEVYL